jgi:hypothetical protein
MQFKRIKNVSLLQNISMRSWKRGDLKSRVSETCPQRRGFMTTWGERGRPSCDRCDDTRKKTNSKLASGEGVGCLSARARIYKRLRSPGIDYARLEINSWAP